MSGLSGPAFDLQISRLRDVRWQVTATVWLRPPRFLHDPQRGLKFVIAKREFQPN
jgi:hypothetical protein